MSDARSSRTNFGLRSSTNQKSSRQVRIKNLQKGILLMEGGVTQREAAQKAGVSRSSLQRAQKRSKSGLPLVGTNGRPPVARLKAPSNNQQKKTTESQPNSPMNAIPGKRPAFHKISAVKRPRKSLNKPIKQVDIVVGSVVTFIGSDCDSHCDGPSDFGASISTSLVVVVHNHYDRDTKRKSLSNCLTVLSDGVIGIVKALTNPLLARSVTEYCLAEDSGGGCNRAPRYNRCCDGGGTEEDLLCYLQRRYWRLLVVDCPASLAALARRRGGGCPLPAAQSTSRVLMVAPTAFQWNPDTAADNHYMQSTASASNAAVAATVAAATGGAADRSSDDDVGGANGSDSRGGGGDADAAAAAWASCGGEDGSCSVAQRVLLEHSALVRCLRRAGVHVTLFGHDESTPDAVFPNNWFSTHAATESVPRDGDCDGDGDGEGSGSDSPPPLGPAARLVLYPMAARSRRLERRPRILTHPLFRKYAHTLDLSPQEVASPPQFLEGTGSLVLDRVHRVAYVALSGRATAPLCTQWAQHMGYRLLTFTAADGEGRPVYHTNVIMSCGTSVAVVCLDAIVAQEERQAVARSLADTGHEVVSISQQQVTRFCGNVLELCTARGQRVLAMSSAAFAAFTPEQRQLLRRHYSHLLHSPLSAIESIGGGGVRCTIAELF